MDTTRGFPFVDVQIECSVMHKGLGESMQFLLKQILLTYPDYQLSPGSLCFSLIVFLCFVHSSSLYGVCDGRGPFEILSTCLMTEYL